jgi:hypothetical protein
MSQIWENHPKPWPEDVCLARYTMGTQIGLRPLADESGVSFGTLREWSRRTTPTWPEQREQYRNSVRSESYRKSTEKISEAISDANLELVQEHLKAWNNKRKIAARFDAYVLVVLKAKESGETVPPGVQRALEFLLELGGRASVNAYTAALQAAIAGERQAAYLDLVDPTTLEREAAKHGLSLTVLDELEEADAA